MCTMFANARNNRYRRNDKRDSLNKKFSYRLGTARHERLPKIAEMDVEMTT